jgi:hypothetical protein
MTVAAACDEVPRGSKPGAGSFSAAVQVLASMRPWTLMACLPLLVCALAGCSGDEDDVRTVRLEFVNMTPASIGVWEKGLDAEGAIMVHMQRPVAAQATESHEQLLVMRGLDRFQASMSLAGEAPEVVSLDYDQAGCAGVDPVVFRVVARTGGLPARTEYEASLSCP